MFDALTALLVGVARQLGEPPGDDGPERWGEAIRGLFARTPLSRQYRCTIGRLGDR